MNASLTERAHDKAATLQLELVLRKKLMMAGVADRQKNKKKKESSRISFVESSVLGSDHDKDALRLLRSCNFMEEVSKWSCDIHKIGAVSNGNPLVLVAACLWNTMDIHTLKEIKQDKFMKFMAAVQKEYLDSNQYHNKIHAADVTQTISMFLRDPTVDTILTLGDRFCGIIAAAVHDMGHPGTNNNFGVITRSEWAVVYNDRSILENMHVSRAFRLMKEKSELDVLDGFHPDSAREMRGSIINNVLGTDMSSHFEDITLFQAQVSRHPLLFSSSSLLLLLL
jgi:hypothetical protein